MLNLRGWRGCRSIPLFVLERVSLNAIHIIDILSASEETKDGRTPNPVDLGQIPIVPNLPDDFGLAHHMAVVLMVFQTADICFDFYGRILHNYKLAEISERLLQPYS